MVFECDHQDFYYHLSDCCCLRFGLSDHKMYHASEIDNLQCHQFLDDFFLECRDGANIYAGLMGKTDMNGDVNLANI